MVRESDLVIIATPLSSYKDVIKKIKSSLKEGSIVTDVSSVKKKVISLIEKKYQKIFRGFHLILLQEQKKVVLIQVSPIFLKIDGVF